MKISARATLVDKKDVRGTRNTPSYTILRLSFPIEDVGPERLGLLSTFVGERIDVTIMLSPFVDGATGKSGRQARLDEAAPGAAAVVLPARAEIPRPLEEEECRRCGLRIGPDPDRRFYTPAAGPPQPMHGACAAAAAVEFFGRLDDPPAAVEVAPPDGPPVDPAEPTAADADWIARAVGEIAEGIAAEDDGAPAPEPVPVELPDGVAGIGAEAEALPAGWAFTTDPPRSEPPAEMATDSSGDPAAELPAHLASIAAASDAAFDGLGPSESTRRGRRSRVTGEPATTS